MTRLRALALGCVAIVLAQPVLASRNLESLVLNTFVQRCLVPMQAGGLPDVHGLTAPAGSAELGKPGGAEIEFANVDGPMSLRVQTLPAGVTSCALSLDLSGDFNLSQINTALFSQLAEEGFAPVPSCESATIAPMYVAEGPAASNGRRLGVMSFVIRLSGLPDQLSLIAAESDVPLTPDTSCANQPGETQ